MKRSATIQHGLQPCFQLTLSRETWSETVLAQLRFFPVIQSPPIALRAGYARNLARHFIQVSRPTLVGLEMTIMRKCLRCHFFNDANKQFIEIRNRPDSYSF